MKKVLALMCILIATCTQLHVYAGDSSPGVAIANTAKAITQAVDNVTIPVAEIELQSNAEAIKEAHTVTMYFTKDEGVYAADVQAGRGRLSALCWC